MASIINKADQLIAEAEKKMTPMNFFQFIFNKTSKIEHSIDCYQRAGNLLKVAKNWGRAAYCFTKSAELNEENDNRYDAALIYIDAANCFKKYDTQSAIESLEKAIEIFTDLGRFCAAAKHHQAIAEIYELQLYDLRNAMNHYEQASDYFRSEENNASSETCLLKIAHYSAIFEDYQRAIEIYQQIALAHVTGTLLKYNVHTFLFKAALCHLSADILSGKQVIMKYQELFPMFVETNECKFLIKLVEGIESDDVNSFIAAKINFFSKFRSDELVTTLLIRIQKIMSNGIDLR